MAGQATQGWSSKVFRTPPRPGTEIREASPRLSLAAHCSAQLPNRKRFLLGTHHKVEPPHLQRYLAEFNYRLNCRTLETNRFHRLLRACLTTHTVIHKEFIAVPDQA
jgi:hypothetical protein